MKALSILVCFLPIHLFAQVFPTSESAWWIVGYGWHGPFQLGYTTCGDTIINSRAYQKHYISIPSSAQDFEQFDEYQGATRVEGDSVWCMPAEQAEELLLFNFDLAIGDSINLVAVPNPEFNFTMYAEDVSYFELNGITRKKIQLINSSGEEEIWLEGIGNNWIPFFRGISDFTVSWVDLACFWQGDSLLYTSNYWEESDCEKLIHCKHIITETKEITSTDWQFFPNPAKDFLTLFNQNETYTKPIRLNIFNATGLLVEQRNLRRGSTFRIPLSNLTAGLYIFELEEREKKLSLQHFKIVIQE